MVTSQGGHDEILEGMSAGADDYLIKPLDPDDLQARLIAAARVTSLHRQLAEQRAELEGLNHELTAIARRDPLTGLGNRRALEEDLELLEARVTRYGHRYCMALLDVDLLQVLQRHLRPPGRRPDPADRRRPSSRRRHAGATRSTATAGRSSCASSRSSPWRPAPSRSSACGSALKRLGIPHVDSPFGVLTISAGMAMLDPGHTRSATEVLKEADEALYRAKQLGRNRVEQPVPQPADRMRGGARVL